MIKLENISKEELKNIATDVCDAFMAEDEWSEDQIVDEQQNEFYPISGGRKTEKVGEWLSDK